MSFMAAAGVYFSVSRIFKGKSAHQEKLADKDDEAAG